METRGQAPDVARQPAAERFPFTKFLPPSLDDRVATARPVSRLAAAIGARRLVVVVAPAGSGKTTALAAWAATIDGGVLWARLGPDDDDPSVLAAALLEGGRRQLGEDFGGRVAQLLAYPGAAPTPRQLATSLVNDLGERGSVTIVLDDVHEVTSPGAIALLDDVLDHLPPRTQVALGSRVEPSLSLPRRRVRGEVADLGLADLLLDHDDVAVVLARDGAVGAAEVEAVLAASGGWAAAVRLATAQTAADVPSPPWPWRDADLVSFLREEVLDTLPERLRGFLLETSILDELAPAQCDAVTERTDSAAILAELDRRNLFLSRHRAAAGDTWQMHDLFAAFLREQLTARYSGPHLASLHRRAAAALPPLRALPHLLAAGDAGAAADLIVEIAFADIDLGTVLALKPAIESLPAETLEADHRLVMLLVWPWLAAGRAHDVIGHLEPRRDRLLSSGRTRAAAEVDTLLGEAYLQLGDLDRAGGAIEHALHATSEPWHRATALLLATWWRYYRNDWEAVSRHAAAALDLALTSGDPALGRTVGSGLSPLLLFIDRGPAWAAGAVERIVSGLTEGDGAALTAMRPVRAGAALLGLDVTGATRELRQCLVESDGYGRIAWKHQEAEALLLAVCLGTGDLATLHAILDRALPQLDAPVFRQYRHPYVHAALRAHWLRGEHRAVVAACERLVLSRQHSGLLEEEVLRAVAAGMLARIDGRVDEALAVLRDGEQAQRDGRCWLWVGMPGLDRASVLLEDGRAAAAVEAALPTLDMAARLGAGVLLPAARANGPVLERCLQAGVHPDLLRAVLAASGTPQTARGIVAIPGTDEALSARELEVLEQVATGASNRDIATALFISEVTVKSHLTRVFRKLGATSRTQAVARARDLRLL